VTVLFGLFSLGPRLVIRGHHTNIPGPWAVLRELPLFNSVVPTRFALVLAPLVGVLLALGVDEFARWYAPRASPSLTPLRMIWYGLLALALLPIAPTPLPAVGRTPVPGFVADGTWRRYIPEGRSLVTVPLPRGGIDDGIYWAADSKLGFAVPRGYFIGPAVNPAQPGKLGAMYGAPDRPTVDLLEYAWSTGKVPVISPGSRRTAQVDLRYWRAAVVILAPQTNEEALWKTVSQLLGAQPTWVDGVWLWTVPAG
jgi:hypothetical protein